MKTLCLLSLAAGAILLSSCNTFIGLGRDMRIGGQAMENGATKVSGGGGGAGGGDVSGAPVY